MGKIKKDGKYSVGKIFTTKENCKIEIIEWVSYDQRKVRFLDDFLHESITKIIHIKNGFIKNPYHKSVSGVGYNGYGAYKSRENYSDSEKYMSWKCMVHRCYSEKFKERCLTYEGVTVCEEWHNFQNFAEWYNEHFPKIDNIKFQLDKDLLQQDIKDKVYSPSTCVFLPNRVNKFLANKYTSNTSGYIGVSWDKTNKKWVAQIKLLEGNKYLGLFPTQEIASHAYQQARAEQAEKVKEYLRSLNYLPEEIIELIK